jgi:hypothetical protein
MYDRSVKALQNNTQEFSLFLKENTILHHYKDQVVNTV